VLSFSRTVAVPDLKGKAVIEANEILSKSGLYLKVEGEDYDPVIPTGSIIRQDIPHGNKVKEQRGIKVVISKGSRVMYVPDLVGQTVEEAEAAAIKNGLKTNRIIRVHSNTIEKDKVIAQRPIPEEALKTNLSLVVSSGPYDIILSCPDLIGKSINEVADISKKLGLKIEATGAGKKVRTQKPKPNSLIKTGETIYIILEGDTETHG
jgi:serine/threonine-protein kinase